MQINIYKTSKKDCDIERFITGLQKARIIHIMLAKIVVIIRELVTLYDVFISLFMALFREVILDIVRGMLEPTSVMITIYIDNVIL